jgi:hypothetical protein
MGSLTVVGLFSPSERPGLGLNQECRGQECEG